MSSMDVNLDMASAGGFRRAMLEANPEPLLVIGSDGRIIDANQAADAILGKSSCPVVGHILFKYMAKPGDVVRIMESVFRGERVQKSTQLVVGEYGRQVQVAMSAGLYHEKGQSFAVVVMHDITDLKQFEAQLAFQAHNDPLTALPNRVLLREHLTRSIEQARGDGCMVSLMLIDLDDFMDVNEAFGHAVGDEVLRHIAMRIYNLLGESGLVGRIDGDEFAIVSTNVVSPYEVEEMAERVMTALGKPLQLDTLEIVVNCSIGITFYPLDGDTAEHMLRDAATALHRAKANNKGGRVYFTAEMNQAVRRRIQIGNHLRFALRNDELYLHFQPRARLSDGALTGVETLLRWNSSELGFVSPAEFIPVAERNGLIIPIGEWVLNCSCRQAVQWREQTGVWVSVAVNLSMRQLSDDNIVHVVAQALEQSGLPAEYLELELTESMLMKDTHRLMRILTVFKEFGVKLAIDDFGTGYSSLAYLKRFPLDYLKIDRSFVVDLPDDQNDVAIVKTIIAMSHHLDLKVIAEGVENRAQQILLEAHGCDEMQGYLYARPMPADELLAMIRRGSEVRCERTHGA